jgi:hypothetical protein
LLDDGASKEGEGVEQRLADHIRRTTLQHAFGRGALSRSRRDRGR